MNEESYGSFKLEMQNKWSSVIRRETQYDQFVGIYCEKIKQPSFNADAVLPFLKCVIELKITRPGRLMLDILEQMVSNFWKQFKASVSASWMTFMTYPRFMKKFNSIDSAIEQSELIRTLSIGKLCSLLDHLSTQPEAESIKKLISVMDEATVHRLDAYFIKHPELRLHLSAGYKMKGVGHRLGLRGAEHEGQVMSLANISTLDRFKQFQPKANEPMNLDFKLPKKTSHTALFNGLLQHGNCNGLHASWFKHAFSFHTIRDRENIHIIYVNRGQPHEQADIKQQQPLMAFTMKADEAEKVIQSLHEVLLSQDRQKISDFINHNLMQRRNDALSEVMAKSTQKVGNCTIANANIAWHLALASAYMKKNNCSLEEAYKETKPTYKQMRIDDRIDAIKTLLTLKQDYSHLEFGESLLEGIAKINKDPKKNGIQRLMQSLNQEEKVTLLNALLELVPSRSTTFSHASLLGQCSTLMKDELSVAQKEKMKQITTEFHEQCTKNLVEQTNKLREKMQQVDISSVLSMFSPRKLP